MNVICQELLTNYLADGPADAPVVLMLHGWGADAKSFAGLAAALAPKFRVIRLDLPGFGGTQAPSAAWQVNHYAQFVRQFMEKLGIADTEAVVGHSFGGRLVIKGLSEGIFSAHKAILLDSAGIRPAVSWRRHTLQVVAKTGKTVMLIPGLSRFAPAMRRRLYRAAGSDDYLKAGPMREIFLNTIEEDLSADAARIAVPTLLIWGADDTDTPPADGRTLANLIPGSSLSVIAGAGHFVHIDAPDRVIKLVKEFLA